MKYKDKNAIGYCSVCAYGGVELIDIIEEAGEQYAIAAFNFSNERGIITRSKVRVDGEGRPFFMKCYERYYLDEFMRA